MKIMTVIEAICDSINKYKTYVNNINLTSIVSENGIENMADELISLICSCNNDITYFLETFADPTPEIIALPYRYADSNGNVSQNVIKILTKLNALDAAQELCKGIKEKNIFTNTLHIILLTNAEDVERDITKICTDIIGEYTIRNNEENECAPFDEEH